MINLAQYNPLPFTLQAILTHAVNLYRIQVPYIWGGKDPDFKERAPFPTEGLDCSGFVTYPWWLASAGKLDVRGTHGSRDLFRELDDSGRPENALPGDLIFYGPDGHVEHVMLHLAAGLVIGQAFGGQANTKPDQSRAHGCVSKLLPLMYRSDIVGCRRPRYAPM